MRLATLATPNGLTFPTTSLWGLPAKPVSRPIGTPPLASPTKSASVSATQHLAMQVADGTNDASLPGRATPPDTVQRQTIPPPASPPRSIVKGVLSHAGKVLTSPFVLYSAALVGGFWAGGHVSHLSAKVLSDLAVNTPLDAFADAVLRSRDVKLLGWASGLTPELVGNLLATTLCFSAVSFGIGAFHRGQHFPDSLQDMPNRLHIKNKHLLNFVRRTELQVKGGLYGQGCITQLSDNRPLVDLKKGPADSSLMFGAAKFVGKIRGFFENNRFGFMRALAPGVPGTVGGLKAFPLFSGLCLSFFMSFMHFVEFPSTQLAWAITANGLILGSFYFNTAANAFKDSMIKTILADVFTAFVLNIGLSIVSSKTDLLSPSFPYYRMDLALRLFMVFAEAFLISKFVLDRREAQEAAAAKKVA
ncbi:MAG: hypothetical protein HQM16_02880 [Deltaproteobacteria bacterium]|nr:hypothetical protein [Deltaproteobacteria bacterium]